MQNNRVINFINFLYEETEQNNKIIEEELKEAGLNTEILQNKIHDLIEQTEIINREEKLEA